jgi:GntR family transcriptional regulator, N-acetylglucosamine utilization regulator
VSSDEFGAGTLDALLRSSPGSPLHSQVEDRLRQLIRSGELAPGTELPGELDLAATLQLSRHTIRHALTTLANEGLVRRERGRGTHVLDPLAVNERRLNHFYAFAWEVRARGLEQRSHVLEFATLNAPPDLATRLNLVTDQMVQRIVRLRLADGEPLIVETAYFPRTFAEGLELSMLERASVYDEIERRHGLRVSRAHETIRPTVLSRSVATLLRVRTGSPAFHIQRTTWAGSQPVEWQESIVRGDRFLYSVDLDRTETDVAFRTLDR